VLFARRGLFFVKERSRYPYICKRGGIERGIEQGSYQTKLETAAALKKLGVDIIKIAEGTGLSWEEIEAL